MNNVLTIHLYIPLLISIHAYTGFYIITLPSLSNMQYAIYSVQCTMYMYMNIPIHINLNMVVCGMIPFHHCMGVLYWISTNFIIPLIICNSCILWILPLYPITTRSIIKLIRIFLFYLHYYNQLINQPINWLANGFLYCCFLSSFCCCSMFCLENVG